MNSTADTTNGTPISHLVIEKVAAATNTDPMDLEPLFGRIDPDALDALFDDGAGTITRMEGQVTFPMSGCEVTVTASGTVDVTTQADHHGAPVVESANRSSLSAGHRD